jgi:predicted nuclease of restriction endonuclease-like RecB superfamily
MGFRRESKFDAVPTPYGCRKYRSKAEARYAATLDTLLAGGAITSWKYEPTYELRVFGELVCKYKPDFEIEHSDGSKEIVEVKGFATPEWRLKWKLFVILMAREHPATKLTVHGTSKSFWHRRTRKEIV